MDIVPVKRHLDMLTIYEVRGDKDDEMTAHFVRRVGDNPAAIKYGRTNIVTFVTKGLWELSGGKVEEPEVLQAGWGPYEEHRSGKCTYRALEDGSEIITIIPDDREQFWDRRRVTLPKGGDFIGDSLEAEELLYVVSGTVTVVGYGNEYQPIAAGNAVRMGSEKKIHVQAKDDIDVVYMKYKP